MNLAGCWKRMYFSFLNTNLNIFSLLSSIAKAIKPETQQKKEKAQQKTAEERSVAKKARRVVCTITFPSQSFFLQHLETLLFLRMKTKTNV